MNNLSVISEFVNTEGTAPEKKKIHNMVQDLFFHLGGIAVT